MPNFSSIHEMQVPLKKESSDKMEDNNSIEKIVKKFQQNGIQTEQEL